LFGNLSFQTSLLEKRIVFEDLIEMVATKGGITEEGTKVIGEKSPEIIEEMFIKTLDLFDKPVGYLTSLAISHL
jgi:pyrroline-5-carboxylate reductase